MELLGLKGALARKVRLRPMSRGHSTIVGTLSLLGLLASATAIEAAPTGSCIVDKSYYYCIEYRSGFSDTAARQNCSFAGGRYSGSACPARDRQGACEVHHIRRNRTHWFKYYKRTWTQMSYKSQQTACQGWADGGFNRVRWIKGDPDDPSAPAFEPADQFPHYPLGEIRRGGRVLAPRQGEAYLYPAIVTYHKTVDRRCSYVRYYDRRSELLFKSAPLKRLDWEVGTRIACRRSGSGPYEEGTIVAMIGSQWTVNLGGSRVKVASSACRDLRTWQHAGKHEAFCRKKQVERPEPKRTPLRRPERKPKRDKELEQLEKDLKELEKPIE